MTRLAVCLLCAVAAQAAPPPADPAAVAEVRAGTRTVAHATWWGFDPVNATAALQAALDSGAREVIVDDVGLPWIVDGLLPRSNTVITFAKGCEVQARRGQFKGTGDCLVRLSQVHDVTLSGYGATFRMWRADYGDPTQYKKAEWRHSISILSSENIQVLGLRLVESGGDGLYLGVARRGVTNRGVTIRDVVCERQYRQGISVISAQDLLIENTVLRDTAGTAPMAGIDFEPNLADERLVNCVMRGCRLESNSGAGITLYLAPLTARSEPVSLRFENCTTVGNSVAAAVSTTNGQPDGDVTGTVDFVGCHFLRPLRQGLVVRDKPAKGVQVSFVDCELVDPALDQPTLSPFVLGSRRGARWPLGGVDLRNLTIADPLGRQPLDLDGWAGGLGVERLTGSLVLRDKQGAERRVELTAVQLAQWLPQTALRSYPPYPFTTLHPLSKAVDPARCGLGQAWLRGKANWLLHAAAGDTVRLAVRYGQVGRYAGEPMPVIVTAPSGATAATVKAAFMQDTPLTFTAAETGLYRVTADAGANKVALAESSQAVALSGDDQPIAFIGAATTLWLWVPAGLTHFAVTCFGDGVEGVQARLIDAAGRVVGEQDNISRPQQFAVERPAGAPGEAWQLVLARPSKLAFEDFAVHLQGLPALLSASREALLVP